MRMGKAEAAALLALLLVSSSAAAGWREDASPADIERLGNLTQSRTKGMEEAAAASASDQAAIRSVLQAGTVQANVGKLAGDWRCRTIKLGGITPAVVYGWFRCRITAYHDGRLSFEKLTGSQRTSGNLYPEGAGFVYLGASFVTGEKPSLYSGKGAAAGAPVTPSDQIGFLSQLYDGRVRLELPYPVQESTFDVIELKR